MPADADYLVRRFVPSDAPSMWAAVRASLPGLAHWMPWCTPDYALEDAEAWIRFTQKAWAEQREFPLGIFHAATGAVVGGTGINQINRVHRIGNIGYWVSTPHTGRGVARFAARQAALLGFGELGLTRLEIVALVNNLASQKVAEALGATRECLARNRLFAQGKPQDAVVYSLVPGDLERRASEPKVPQVAAVMVHVDDVDAGLAWYARAFPGGRVVHIDHPSFNFLQVGTTRIELVRADERVGSGAAGTVVYWHHRHFDGWLGHLEALGATRYRGPMVIEGGQRMCQVRDPWGNCIGIRGL